MSEWDEKIRKIFKDNIPVNKETSGMTQAYYGGYLICHAFSNLPEKAERCIVNVTIRNGLILG